MVKTGASLRFNTLKQQRENAELELIIEDFGCAMRSAHRPFVAERNDFTANMGIVWARYVEFCRNHPHQ